MRRSVDCRPDHGTRWRKLPLLALLLFCAPASAASRWYHVEVVVFRYTEPRYADGEQWVVPSILPDYRSATRLTRPLAAADAAASAATGLAAADARMPTAFQPLEPDNLTMRNIAGALRRAADIEVLLHAAWLQPSFGNSGARYVYLDDLPLPEPEPEAEPGLGLDGGIEDAPELDRRRPPAIDPMFDDDVIDLEAVLAPEPEFYGVMRLRTGRQLNVDTDFVLNFEEAPVRLRESRRVLFRETHYFDHPLFGLIVRILPHRLPGMEAVEAPMDEASEAEAADSDGAAAPAEPSEAAEGGVE